MPNGAEGDPMTGTARDRPPARDDFARDHLPPRNVWPDLIFTRPELQYPKRLNCVSTLLDGWIAEGHGDAPCLIAPTETLTYADALKKVKALAHFLLQTNVSAERPIAMLSENSIEHGLMALAALRIGVPFSPIASAYSLKSMDYAKLKHTIDKLTLALIFVQNGKKYEKALAAITQNINVTKVETMSDINDIQIVAVNDPLSNHTVFEEKTRFSNNLLESVGSIVVDIRHKKITPDTIAKILFTSGS